MENPPKDNKRNLLEKQLFSIDGAHNETSIPQNRIFKTTDLWLYKVYGIVLIARWLVAVIRDAASVIFRLVTLHLRRELTRKKEKKRRRTGWRFFASLGCNGFTGFSIKIWASFLSISGKEKKNQRPLVNETSTNGRNDAYTNIHNRRSGYGVCRLVTRGESKCATGHRDEQREKEGNAYSGRAKPLNSAQFLIAGEWKNGG